MEVADDYSELQTQFTNTRKALKKSQEELANDLDISRATIINFEASTRRPQKQTLEKIKAWLAEHRSDLPSTPLNSANFTWPEKIWVNLFRSLDKGGKERFVTKILEYINEELKGNGVVQN